MPENSACLYFLLIKNTGYLIKLWKGEGQIESNIAASAKNQGYFE